MTVIALDIPAYLFHIIDVNSSKTDQIAVLQPKWMTLAEFKGWPSTTENGLLTHQVFEFKQCLKKESCFGMFYESWSE